MGLNTELIELTEYLNWRIDNPIKPVTAKDVINFFIETGYLLRFLPIDHEMFYPKDFTQYKLWKAHSVVAKP